MKQAPAQVRTPLRLRLLFSAVSALSGTLMFLSCADFDIWPLAWMAMVPVIAVVLDERCRSPFFYGWVCGLLANGGGFYWINGLLMRFGHMPAVASLPIFALLVGYQALEIGAFAWTLRRLRDRTELPVVLLAPVTMTALELVTPFVFPWYYAITQAWVRPVIQIADLTGPLGVTFLLLLSNGALYDTIASLRRGERPRWSPVAAAVGTIGLALVYGQVRIHQIEARRAAAPKIQVGVVQANIGIHEKFVPGLRAQQLAVHQRLSAELASRGADLIVWPESAYPYVIDRSQRVDFPESDPRHVTRGFRTPLFFGALTWGRDDEYPYNTALMMDEGGAIRARFDKNFLLVFGEYIPFYERMKWVRNLIPEASNFARGDTVTTFPLEVPRLGENAHVKLGPMICYEDIIPSFGRRLVALRPNVLVNITNDAWFGATSEPWEHLALAVYRAVEHRLDLVRAVNTGVSAFVDSTGRVWKHGRAVDPAIAPGVSPVSLLEPVAVQEATGLYGKIGDLFGVLNLVALLGLAAWAGHRVGRPVAWKAGLSATGLLLGLLVLAAVLASPTEPMVGLGLLAHRSMPSTDETFTVGARLLAGGAVSALLTGFVLRRRFGRRPLGAEAAGAVAAAALGPALLFGRIEGETTSLVFTTLGALASVFAGMRLANRNADRHAGPSKAGPNAASPSAPTTARHEPTKRKGRR